MAGLPGFGAAISVHYVVGYTDWLHVAPVWLAALLYTLGLAFTWRFTGDGASNTGSTQLAS